MSYQQWYLDFNLMIKIYSIYYFCSYFTTSMYCLDYKMVLLVAVDL